MSIHNTTNTFLQQDLKALRATEDGQLIAQGAKADYQKSAPKSIQGALDEANTALTQFEKAVDQAQDHRKGTKLGQVKHGISQEFYKNLIQNPQTLKQVGVEALKEAQAQVGSEEATLEIVRNPEVDTKGFIQEPQFEGDVDFARIDRQSQIKTTGDDKGTLVRERDAFVEVYEAQRLALTDGEAGSLKDYSQSVRNAQAEVAERQTKIKTIVREAYGVNEQGKSTLKYLDATNIKYAIDRQDLTSAEGRVEFEDLLSTTATELKTALQQESLEHYLKLTLLTHYARNIQGLSEAKKQAKLAAIALNLGVSEHLDQAVTILGNINSDLYNELDKVAKKLVENFDEEGEIKSKTERKLFSQEVANSFKVSKKKGVQAQIAEDIHYAVRTFSTHNQAFVDQHLNVENKLPQLADTLQKQYKKLDKSIEVRQEAFDDFEVEKNAAHKSLDKAITDLGGKVPTDANLGGKLGTLGHLVYAKAGALQGDISRQADRISELKDHLEALGDSTSIAQRAQAGKTETAVVLGYIAISKELTALKESKVTNFKEYAVLSADAEAKLEAAQKELGVAKKELALRVADLNAARSVLQAHQNSSPHSNLDSTADEILNYDTTETELKSEVSGYAAKVKKAQRDVLVQEQKVLEAESAAQKTQASLQRETAEFAKLDEERKELAVKFGEIYKAHHKLLNSVTALHKAASEGHIGAKEVDTFAQKLEALLLNKDIVSPELEKTLRQEIAKAKAEVVAQLKVRIASEVEGREVVKSDLRKLEESYTGNFEKITSKARAFKEITAPGRNAIIDTAQKDFDAHKNQAKSSFEKEEGVFQARYQEKVDALQAQLETEHKARKAQLTTNLEAAEGAFNKAKNAEEAAFEPKVSALEAQYTAKNEELLKGLSTLNAELKVVQGQLKDARSVDAQTDAEKAQKATKIRSLTDQFEALKYRKETVAQQLEPAKTAFEAEKALLQEAHNAKIGEIALTYAEQVRKLEEAFDQKTQATHQQYEADVKALAGKVATSTEAAEGVRQGAVADAESFRARREIKANKALDRAFIAENTAIKVQEAAQHEIVLTAHNHLSRKPLVDRRITHLSSQLLAAEKALRNDAEAQKLVAEHKRMNVGLNAQVQKQQQITAHTQAVLAEVQKGFQQENVPQGPKADHAKLVILEAITRLKETHLDLGRSYASVPVEQLVTTLAANSGLKLFEEFTPAEIGQLILQTAGGLLEDNDALLNVKGEVTANSEASATLKAAVANAQIEIRGFKEQLQTLEGKQVPKDIVLPSDVQYQRKDILDLLGEQARELRIIDQNGEINADLFDHWQNLHASIASVEAQDQDSAKVKQLADERVAGLDKLNEAKASLVNHKTHLEKVEEKVAQYPEVRAASTELAAAEKAFADKQVEINKASGEEFEASTKVTAFEQGKDLNALSEVEEAELALLRKAVQEAREKREALEAEQPPIQAQVVQKQQALVEAKAPLLKEQNGIYANILVKIDAQLAKIEGLAALPANATVQDRIDHVQARIDKVTQALSNIQAAENAAEQKTVAEEAAAQTEFEKAVKAKQEKVEQIKSEIEAREAEIEQKGAEIKQLTLQGEAQKEELARETANAVKAYQLAFELFGLPISARRATELVKAGKGLTDPTPNFI